MQTVQCYLVHQCVSVMYMCKCLVICLSSEWLPPNTAFLPFSPVSMYIFMKPISYCIYLYVLCLCICACVCFCQINVVNYVTRPQMYSSGLMDGHYHWPSPFTHFHLLLLIYWHLVSVLVSVFVCVHMPPWVARCYYCTYKYTKEENEYRL